MFKYTICRVLVKVYNLMNQGVVEKSIMLSVSK